MLENRERAQRDPARRLSRPLGCDREPLGPRALELPARTVVRPRDERREGARDVRLDGRARRAARRGGRRASRRGPSRLRTGSRRGGARASRPRRAPRGAPPRRAAPRGRRSRPGASSVRDFSGSSPRRRRSFTVRPFPARARRATASAPPTTRGSHAVARAREDAQRGREERACRIRRSPLPRSISTKAFSHRARRTSAACLRTGRPSSAPSSVRKRASHIPPSYRRSRGTCGDGTSRVAGEREEVAQERVAGERLAGAPDVGVFRGPGRAGRAARRADGRVLARDEPVEGRDRDRERSLRRETRCARHGTRG